MIIINFLNVKLNQLILGVPNIHGVPCDIGFECPTGSIAQVPCVEGYYCPAQTGSAIECPPG